MTFSSKLIHSTAILCFWLLCDFGVNDAASCTEYDEPESCDGNTLCLWYNPGNYCACASAVTQEVLFVMDGSGSVGSEAWKEEVNFVNGMIETGVDPQTQVAVFEFESGNFPIWNFSQAQQPRSLITDAVDAVIFDGGATWMKTALNYAIKLFEATDRPSIPNLLMFITDGNPWPTSNSYNNNQAVCNNNDLKDALDAIGVTTVLIGVGDGWDPNQISCLVDDEENQILEVAGFDPNDFALVRDLTDDFLCPATINLRLTEVRLEDAPDNNPDYDSETDAKFVEFYINGVTIPLASNNLVMSGVVNGTITKTSDGGQNLTSGEYLVFYDSNFGMPNCTDCDNCIDLDEDDLCDAAIYISCNGQDDECTFNAGSNPYTNEDFIQTVLDGSDLSEIVSVTAGADDDWPLVTDGWTVELFDRRQVDYAGKNWEMSCFQRGTPGDEPIEDCTGDCVDVICQQNGDEDASCGTGAFATCECTTLKNFFLAGTTCKPLQPPPLCTATYVADINSQYGTLVISWNPVIIATKSVILQYEARWPEYAEDPEDYTKSGPLTNRVHYAYYESSDGSYPILYPDIDMPPQVQSIVTLNGTVSERVLSNWQNCTLITSAPSLAPTVLPTLQLPVINSCSATIRQASTNLDVVWDAAETSSETEDSVDGYYVYLELGDGTISITKNVSGSATSWQTLLTKSEIDDGLNCSVAAIGYDSFGNIDEDRMQELATKCDLGTPAPTPAPSLDPTSQPSVSPSDVPTNEPTTPPTYEDYVLTDCQGLLDGDENGDKELTITWIETEPSETYDRELRLRRHVGSSSSSDTEGPVRVTNSPFKVQTANGDFSDMTLADGYYLYPWAKSYSTAESEEEQPGTWCNIVTSQPSRAPSNQPSGEPTARPTDLPSIAPSNEPTAGPTPSPTYKTLNISYCEAEFAAGSNAFTVTFDQPPLDPQGVLTPASVVYRFDFFAASGGAAYETIVPGVSEVFSHTVLYSQGMDATQGVTVSILDDDDELLGPSVACDVTSQAPTNAPSDAPSKAPTMAPTWSNPVVYVDENSFDAGCELLQGELKCEVQESSISDTVIDIIREPAEFPYDVTLDWKIEFIGAGAASTATNVGEGEITGSRRLQQPQSTAQQADGDATEDDFEGPTSGSITIAGAETGELEQNTGSVSITLIQEENEDPDEEGEGVERFYFVLSGCEVSDTSAGASIYSCSPGDPSTILMFITNVEADALTTDRKEDPEPIWIWFVVGAGVLALALVGFLGYRFFKAKKLAEAMEAQKKRELEKQVQLDDVSSFGESGDSVSFNPIATGSKEEIKSAGAYIEEQIERQKDQMDDDFVKLDFEPEQFRESFGQVKLGQGQGPFAEIEHYNQQQSLGGFSVLGADTIDAALNDDVGMDMEHDPDVAGN